MGRITKEGLKQEKQFMLDYWEFRRNFWMPEDNDDYWNELVKASDELYDKYQSSYCRDLIIDCMADIDARARGSRSSLRDTINALRKREGLRPFTKEEWSRND